MLIGGEGEKSVSAQATTKEKSSDVGRVRLRPLPRGSVKEGVEKDR
jgi:hypothetical protein